MAWRSLQLIATVLDYFTVHNFMSAYQWKMQCMGFLSATIDAGFTVPIDPTNGRRTTRREIPPMKILSGLYRPSEGELVLDVRRLAFPAPEMRGEHGIEMDYWDFAFAGKWQRLRCSGHRHWMAARPLRFSGLRIAASFSSAF